MNKSHSSLSPKWIVAIVVIVIAVMLSIGTATQGHVRGEEFSPTHFQSRTFEFYQIPILKLQVSPVWRSSATPPVALYLSGNGLISVPSTPPASWDLVSLSWGGNTGEKKADAALLVDWLELDSRLGTDDWEQWSKAHPAAAKKLWPTVQQLAQRELYLLIPDVFLVAQRETEPQKLASELKSLLKEQQIEMADELRAAGADAQAEELLTEASQGL